MIVILLFGIVFVQAQNTYAFKQKHTGTLYNTQG